MVRAAGRKKSNFPAQTTVLSGASLDYFVNGVNFKISFDDFVGELGVTGTIVQDGAVTGTPVLDTQGSVNNIRNIEASVGITSAVSAENGVTLNTDFTPIGTGVDVLFNETTDPQWRSIIAGTGINVAQSGNNIQISTSGVPSSSKTVIINQLSDFPDPISGVITLEADTDYFISADISTANRFIMQSNTVLRGPDILIGNLTYTGTGIMITAIDATCKITCLQCICTSGTFCNVSNTSGNEGTSTFIMDGVVVAANNGGTLTSLSGHQIRQVRLTFITNGFVYAGTGWTNLNCTTFSGVQLAGKTFDLGSTTFDRPLFDNFSIDLSAGTFGISGIASSGNINAGGLGVVLTSRTTGAGSLLENISVDDDSWTFDHNEDVGDTHPDGLLSMQANATNTIIGSIGVGVLIAGTWVVESTSQATGTTGGRVTYNGSRSAKLPITASITIEPISGAAQLMGAFAAIGGVVVANSLRTGTATPGSPTSITIPWQNEFSDTEFVEIFVSNQTTTTDVLVSSAVLRVN